MKKIRKNWEPGLNQNIKDAAKRHGIIGNTHWRSKKAKTLDRIRFLENPDYDNSKQ